MNVLVRFSTYFPVARKQRAATSWGNGRTGSTSGRPQCSIALGRSWLATLHCPMPPTLHLSEGGNRWRSIARGRWHSIALRRRSSKAAALGRRRSIAWQELASNTPRPQPQANGAMPGARWRRWGWEKRLAFEAMSDFVGVLIIVFFFPEATSVNQIAFSFLTVHNPQCLFTAHSLH